jgi:Icc-related predicted phosphoesterase
MRILAIADRSPRLPASLPQYVADQQIDVVITAGDLFPVSIRDVGACGVPVLGVYGNHCDGTYLGALGIDNLHGRQVTLGPVTFAGVEGCVRYKDSDTAIMHTQAEYATLLADLPASEVLVTHCPPRGINDHDDLPHVGIDALRDWVDTHQPALLIHGHTYPKQPITQHHTTQIAYVHGARIITL